MDGPDPLASNGLPYVLEHQELVGRGPAASAIDTLFTGSPFPLNADGPTGPCENEMPLFLDLVDLQPRRRRYDRHWAQPGDRNPHRNRDRDSG